MYGNNFYPSYGTGMVPNYIPQHNAPYYNAPQTQPQNNAPVNTNKIFVNGIEDVRTRYLPASSEYCFLDNDKPLLYDKKVDATGKMEIKTYDIVPHTDEPTPTVDPTQYVLRKDFEALQDEIKAIRAQLLEKAKEEYNNG